MGPKESKEKNFSRRTGLISHEGNLLIFLVLCTAHIFLGYAAITNINFKLSVIFNNTRLFIRDVMIVSRIWLYFMYFPHSKT